MHTFKAKPFLAVDINVHYIMGSHSTKASTSGNHVLFTNSTVYFPANRVCLPGSLGYFPVSPTDFFIL